MRNKPLSFFLAAGLLAAGTFFVQSMTGKEHISAPDGDKHVLTQQWKQYEDASRADLPQKQFKLLTAITEEAARARLHWDFYDAASRKPSVGGSRNWKLRDSLLTAFAEEVKAYDEPVVSYVYSRQYAGGLPLEDILRNERKLKAGRNDAFYTVGAVSGAMNGLLPGQLRNDFEFVLWSEFLYGTDGARERLAAELDGRYPAAAYLEYRSIPRDPSDAGEEQWLAALQRFAEAYEGKAVSLFAGSDLLLAGKNALDRRDAASAEYEALHARALSFEKTRKGYTTGIDGRIAASCEEVKYLLEQLEDKQIDIYFRADTALLLLRNLDQVKVRLRTDEKKPRTLLEKTLRNPDQRFYVPDTLLLPLPRRDDGTCVLEAWNGTLKTSGLVSAHTLSIALRQDVDGGSRVYVTDYETGKPMAAADLEVFRSGTSLGKEKAVALDGFTPLPASLDGKSKEGVRHTVVASMRDADGFLRRSEELSFVPGRSGTVSYPEEMTRSCQVFLDRKAYRPEETVHFKALLYQTGPGGDLRVVPEGTTVRLELLDPERQTVGEQKRNTNAFGSVSGSFPLPEAARNGSFCLKVKQGDDTWTEYFTVDAFILPTYDLSFDPVDRLYFAGDEVEVTGRLQSYSGHPLSAARVRYRVTGLQDASAAEGTLEPGPDGTFAIRFKTDPDRRGFRHYRVNVSVSDATGETKEFATAVFLTDRFSVTLDLLRDDDTEISMEGAYAAVRVVAADSAAVRFGLRNSQWRQVPGEVDYILEDAAGAVVASGKAVSGSEKRLCLPAAGRYLLKASATVCKPDGTSLTASSELTLLRVKEDDPALPEGVSHFFRLTGPCADGTVRPGEAVCVQAGTSTAPLWVVAGLFGDRGQLLDRTMCYLEGRPGTEGSLSTVRFETKASYPEALRVVLFYFREGRSHTFTRSFTQEKRSLDLPLTVTSFEDRALPGREYTVRLKTAADVEAVASVFDKSTEAIAGNGWYRVDPPRHVAAYISISARGGGFDRNDRIRMTGTRGLTLYNRKMASGKEAEIMEYVEEESNAVMMADAMAPMPTTDAVAGVSAEEAVDAVAVRSDFATTLAFAPHLRPDGAGNLELRFRTSDKLSTFCVQVFAHAQDMRNALIRREMMVTLPVKVSVVEPQYLYEGDRYVLHATVSNSSDAPVGGFAALQVTGTTPQGETLPPRTLSVPVTVPAGGSVPVSFDVPLSAPGSLDLKVVFADADHTFSDGVSVTVPVKAARQVLTESHSAVCLAGSDREALVRRLEAAFTGTSSFGATLAESDIRQMLRAVIPDKAEPAGKDILSLSEAWYVRRMAERLGGSLSCEMTDEMLLEALVSCRNADGGFGWFEGMNSSPVLTATLLERAAKLSALGGSIPGLDTVSAVAYLDREQFLYDDSVPAWCGRLSYAQYAFVRSLYASVPFSLSAGTLSGQKNLAANLKDYRKWAKEYLVPGKKDGRGLNGWILAKARRLRTLQNLLDAGKHGTALADAWGVTFGAVSRMEKSLRADVLSLLEYAVAHPDGGMYYPNAVLPWRGLLESEAYAHALLCDLLSGLEAPDGVPEGQSCSPAAVSDGIRLWLMLQKETQQWDADPAFLDAVHSVLGGSEALLSTSVVSLTKTYGKPFGEIVRAGNGFTVERRFFRAGTTAKEREEIAPGDTLHVGDRITAEYRIWSQENRSFVKLSAPREALLRPVDQRSAPYGWWSSPLRARNGWSLTPQGYRDVREDRTDYYFDVYPEEKTTVSEDFFVTQEGVFAAPVVTVESLYAPHYRANAPFTGTLTAE